MKPKNTICLWFNKNAYDAARFYAATSPDGKVTAVHEAPGDYPGGKKGDVLTVEFTVLGIPCLGLNGGPAFKHTEAFSFQIAKENQEETDRYWNAIVEQVELNRKPSAFVDTNPAHEPITSGLRVI
jgi:predicted 3-demethylubiquinone-9 3-methyltransferase (glyoxalase superfamily)